MSGFAVHRMFQSCRNIFPTAFVTLLTLTHGIPWAAPSKNHRLFRTEPLPTESSLHDDQFPSDRLDILLKALKKEGPQVLPEREGSHYDQRTRIIDPEGNGVKP